MQKRIVQLIFARFLRKNVLVYTKNNEVFQKIVGQKIEIENEGDGKGLKYISFKELDKHSCERLADELTYQHYYVDGEQWKPKFYINGEKFIINNLEEITGQLRERQEDLCKVSGGNVIAVHGIYKVR